MSLLSIPVWTIPPDWSSPVKEGLEWKTEIFGSVTGVEQRRALRLSPRRYLDYNVSPTGKWREYYDALLTTHNQGKFYVPLWHDIVFLANPISIGNTTLLVRGASSEMATAKVLFVQGTDPWSFELYEVTSVATVGTDTQFTFATAAAKAWPKGASVYAVSECFLLAQPSFTRMGDEVFEASIRFDLDGVNDWSSTPVLDTYRSFPVVALETNENGAQSGSHFRHMATLDNDFGPRRVIDFAGTSVAEFNRNNFVNGRTAANDIRSLLYYLKGRCAAAWFVQPTNDFTLAIVGQSADTAIRVERNGFADLNGPSVGRQDIRILLRDGTKLYRRIVSAGAINEQVDGLILDAALGTRVKPDQVVRISFIGVGRLDQDLIELSHVTDTEGVCDYSLVTKAIPDLRTGNDWTPPALRYTTMESCFVPAVFCFDPPFLLDLLTGGTYSWLAGLSNNKVSGYGDSTDTGNEHGITWTMTGTATQLPDAGPTEPISDAFGLSRDSLIPVGAAYGTLDTPQACYWNGSGIHYLPFPATENITYALCTNQDGNIIGGYGFAVGGCFWESGVATVVALGRVFCMKADGSEFYGAGSDGFAASVNKTTLAVTTYPGVTGDINSVIEAVTPDGSVKAGSRQQVINVGLPCYWNGSGIHDLPLLPGGATGYVHGIDDTGNIIVGEAHDGTTTWPVVWWNGTIYKLSMTLTLGEGIDGYAAKVSPDGQTIGGYVDYPSGRTSRAVIWKACNCAFDTVSPRLMSILAGDTNSYLLGIGNTKAVGYTNQLPTDIYNAVSWVISTTAVTDLPHGSENLSFANGISSDETVIFGQDRIGLGVEKACYWDGSGIHYLPFFSGGIASEALCVSADKTIFGGILRKPGTDQACYWTSGTGTLLPFLTGGTQARAQCMKSDGSEFYGWSADTVTFFIPVLWTGGAVHALAMPSGYLYGSIVDCTPSGSVLVGACADASNIQHACFWTGGIGGTVTVLEDLPGGSQSHAQAIDDTGTIIVGSCNDADGNLQPVAWCTGAIHKLSTVVGSDTYPTGLCETISPDGTTIGGELTDVGSNDHAVFWRLA